MTVNGNKRALGNGSVYTDGLVINSDCVTIDDRYLVTTDGVSTNVTGKN